MFAVCIDEVKTSMTSGPMDPRGGRSANPAVMQHSMENKHSEANADWFYLAKGKYWAS